MIAEDVIDRAAHESRICNPDGYRHPLCLCCGHKILHVHDYPERHLRAEGADPEAKTAVVRIVRYVCASCGAVWRILPLFLARHLWRSWAVIEEQTVARPPPHNHTRPLVPERTVRRWRQRLATAARLLMQVLATSASAILEKLAQTVGLDATREQLTLAYVAAFAPPRGRRLADLAGLMHRLAPGIRLM